MLHEELTHEIIKAFYEVHKILGFGFLEQVYQNALYKELCYRGMKVECQKEILVHYLKATGLEVGLLLNFGHSAEFKRKVFTK